MIKTFLLASAALGLATAAASAADLPSRVAPPVYAPTPVITPYNWSGLEFGLTTSYSFRGNKNVQTTPFGGTFGEPSYVSLSKSGFDTVGGGVAYNYQFKPGNGIVVGGAPDEGASTRLAVVTLTADRVPSASKAAAAKCPGLVPPPFFGTCTVPAPAVACRAPWRRVRSGASSAWPCRVIGASSTSSAASCGTARASDAGESADRSNCSRVTAP